MQYLEKHYTDINLLMHTVKKICRLRNVSQVTLNAQLIIGILRKTGFSYLLSNFATHSQHLYILHIGFDEFYITYQDLFKSHSCRPTAPLS